MKFLLASPLRGAILPSVDSAVTDQLAYRQRLIPWYLHIAFLPAQSCKVFALTRPRRHRNR